MEKKVLYTIIFLFSIHIYGQRNCGSQLNLNELRQSDPARYERVMELESRIQEVLNRPVALSTEQSTIFIPVVVHILHNTPAQNISDEQIHSQIQVLNEDFRRLNPDRENTPLLFRPLAGDANIQFFLARVAPPWTSHDRNQPMVYPYATIF